MVVRQSVLILPLVFVHSCHRPNPPLPRNDLNHRVKNPNKNRVAERVIEVLRFRAPKLVPAPLVVTQPPSHH